MSTTEKDSVAACLSVLPSAKTLAVRQGTSLTAAGYTCELKVLVLPRKGGGVISLQFLRVSRSEGQGNESFHFPIGIKIDESLPAAVQAQSRY